MSARANSRPPRPHVPAVIVWDQLDLQQRQQIASAAHVPLGNQTAMLPWFTLAQKLPAEEYMRLIRVNWRRALQGRPQHD